MSDENSRIQLIDRVVTMVNVRTSLLAKLLMDRDGETSSLDNFANDPVFAQFLNCIDDLEESSQKTLQLLGSLKEGERGGGSDDDTDTERDNSISSLDSKIMSTDGLFVQIDRLSQSVGELEYEIAKSVLDYPELVNTLEVIKEALVSTAAYHEVSPLDTIIQRSNTAQSKLKKILFYRYREAGIFSESSSKANTFYAAEVSWLDDLKGANSVIDALGKEAATELVEVLVDSQLVPYQARGRYVGGNLYSLQKQILDQRWDELYRMLGACSAVNIRTVVSVEWNLPFTCYVAFCNRTAEHLQVLLNTEVKHVRLLGDRDPDQRQDHVTMLVQVLESVLNIESEVHTMFDKGVYTLFDASTSADSMPVSSTGSGRRFSASSSRKSFTKPPPNLSHKRSNELKVHYRCTVMSDLLAECFMDPYVQCERRNAEDALQGLVNEDVKKTQQQQPTQPLHPPETNKKSNKNQLNVNKHPPPLSEKELAAYTSSCLAVYDSAVVLFQITRSSMLRCATLSNGKPLMSLLLEYKVMFQIYAEMLRNLLCPALPPPGGAGGGGAGGGGGGGVDLLVVTRKQRVPHPLQLSEEVMACRAIMTADHCIGLIPQLEAEMLHKMHPKYKADVHMKFQCELFEDVISYAIDLLVSSLLGKIDDAAMVHMANTNWAKFTIVGDVSPYVFFLARSLSELLPRLRKVLPEDYFDTLCLRFASDFLDHFLALLLGLKTLGVAGAQQILLDVNEMTPLLLSLHTIQSKSSSSGSGNGSGNGSSAKATPTHAPTKSAGYDDMVRKKSSLLSTVLKLVLSDDKQIDETFHVLWPEGQAADLRTIKKLKSSDHVISSLAQRDSDLNQYVDRRSFNMDESAYATSPQGFAGTISSGFGFIQRKITPKKKDKNEH